jgi:hypothetical protein
MFWPGTVTRTEPGGDASFGTARNSPEVRGSLTASAPEAWRSRIGKPPGAPVPADRPPDVALTATFAAPADDPSTATTADPVSGQRTAGGDHFGIAGTDPSAAATGRTGTDGTEDTAAAVPVGAANAGIAMNDDTSTPDTAAASTDRTRRVRPRTPMTPERTDPTRRTATS